jgi:FixJ family two-component response regulator
MFTSAAQYLRTIEDSNASCVVIAVGMRGYISGLELGKAILSSRRPLPIIYIAGAREAALREQAFLIGCVAYIEEPVSSESLIAAIRLSGASSS